MPPTSHLGPQRLAGLPGQHSQRRLCSMPVLRSRHFHEHAQQRAYREGVPCGSSRAAPGRKTCTVLW